VEGRRGPTRESEVALGNGGVWVRYTHTHVIYIGKVSDENSILDGESVEWKAVEAPLANPRLH